MLNYIQHPFFSNFSVTQTIAFAQKKERVSNNTLGYEVNNNEHLVLTLLSVIILVTRNISSNLINLVSKLYKRNFLKYPRSNLTFG